MMGELKSRVLFLVPCLFALGFAIGTGVSPKLDHEQRTFLNTYFFVGRFAPAEMMRAGLQYPEPEDLGTPTLGHRAELEIPVHSKAQKDLELLIEYSLNPKLSARIIEISINGEKLAEWEVARGKRRISKALRIPSHIWHSGQPLSMTMRTKAQDAPELGMILHAVSVYQMS